LAATGDLNRPRRVAEPVGEGRNGDGNENAGGDKWGTEARDASEDASRDGSYRHGAVGDQPVCAVHSAQ
jgi:hypothetical protein